MPPHQDQQQEDIQQQQEPSIRCIGPYKVTPTIWLSPVLASDTKELHRILNIDNSVHNGLQSNKMVFPFSEEAARYFTERHVTRRIQNRACNEWAIRPAVDGPMIGLVALSPFDHGDMGPCYQGKEPIAVGEAISQAPEGNVLNCGGLGYWLSPEHEGKGIMTEVVRFALTSLARQEVGYERVHGECWVDNVGSRKVMEKTGVMRPAVGVPCFVPKFNAIKDVAHYIYDTE